MGISVRCTACRSPIPVNGTGKVICPNCGLSIEVKCQTMNMDETTAGAYGTPLASKSDIARRKAFAQDKADKEAERGTKWDSLKVM